MRIESKGYNDFCNYVIVWCVPFDSSNTKNEIRYIRIVPFKKSEQYKKWYIYTNSFMNRQIEVDIPRNMFDLAFEFPSTTQDELENEYGKVLRKEKLERILK